MTASGARSSTPPDGLRPAPSGLSQEERAAARREKERAKHAGARAAGTEKTRTQAERRAATAARTGTKSPVVRRGHPPKISVALVAQALAKTGGLIGISAQLLKVERRTVEKYLARYASLQEVRDQAREHALDETEWALIKAARQGEPWAVQWFLRYQGKTRGYQEVRKTEQDTRVQVEVTYTEDALGAGRPSTTVNQLPPPPGEGVRSADGPHIEIVEAEITYPKGEEG